MTQQHAENQAVAAGSEPCRSEQELFFDELDLLRGADMPAGQHVWAAGTLRDGREVRIATDGTLRALVAVPRCAPGEGPKNTYVYRVAGSSLALREFMPDGAEIAKETIVADDAIKTAIFGALHHVLHEINGGA